MIRAMNLPIFQSRSACCFLLALGGVSMLALPACKRDESPAPAAPAPTVRQDRYSVRGVIAQLPDPANPAAELQIRHEAIPHFRGQSGELGMDTMTMPFPLAKGLALDGLKIGDKVTVSFEVDFDAAADKLLAYRATALEPLPAETELDFSPLKK